jgi:hypothetical protein
MITTDPALFFLSKALNAKKKGVSAACRPKKLKPGKHVFKGKLDYEITATVGEDTKADRSFGVPTDDILDLAAHLCGAMRPHLVKAAAVVTEVTRAKLEDRPVKATTFVSEGESVRIPVKEVRRLAKTLAESERGTLSQAIKLERPYAGPVKIVEADVKIA